MAKFKVESLEVKEVNGKRVANCVLTQENGDQYIKKVSIWSDFPNFQNVTFGAVVEGDIVVNAKGYASLYAPKAQKSSPGSFSSPIGGNKIEEVRAKNIEKAQDRKAESIAYFNSVNSAIALLKLGQLGSHEEIQRGIVFWRDWFISEYENWNNQPF